MRWDEIRLECKVVVEIYYERVDNADCGSWGGAGQVGVAGRVGSGLGSTSHR